MRIKTKKNDTSLRVLEILKMLIAEPVSGEDLIRKIGSQQNIENIYTVETLLKYFNTLEFVGLKVEKRRKDKKYCLANFPVEINLDEKELKVLCLLEGYVKNLYQKRIENVFYDFLKNVERGFSKETLALYKSVKSNSVMKTDIDFLCSSSIIRKLEKYCIDSQKLKIGYLSKSNKCTEIFVVEPKSLLYELDKVYLLAYNPKLAQNQKLLLENIIHVVQLPQKVSANVSPNTVVFELRGRLAKSYKLKEGEKIINFSSNNIVVSNVKEDKMTLFKRFLKYGENCKILQPLSMQKEFINFVDKVLANIGGSL